MNGKPQGLTIGHLAGLLQRNLCWLIRHGILDFDNERSAPWIERDQRPGLYLHGLHLLPIDLGAVGVFGHCHAVVCVVPC